MPYLRIIRWTILALGIGFSAVAYLMGRGKGEPTPLAWALLALMVIAVSVVDLIDGRWTWGRAIVLEDSSARIAATVTLLIAAFILIAIVLNM